MVQKRLFDDPEAYIISSKHPRQASEQPVLFSEFVPSEDASKRPHTSGVGEFTNNNTEGDDKLEDGINIKIPIGVENKEHTVPGSISICSWATNSTSEEDSWLEAPVHVSFHPEYFSPEHPMRTSAHYEDIYSILLHHLPRKSVPIGPNHQVDVPQWSPLGAKNASYCSETSEAVSDFELIAGVNNEGKLMGTCVIPMPRSEQSACDSDKVGSGRTDCSCPDEGSVRCVRQHIMEVREKLRKTLGQETFVELGFCDMGEQVALKWSEEEEQLFHEVVFSNPASVGKSFWDNLSVVFPSRTKEDIVSYYFNVFMLRRRAEQNRCDPMNIDSDNDEWQGSDDYGDNEPGMTEEDEDSVVESPVYQDDPGHNQSREDDLHVYDEFVGDKNCVDDENANFGSGRDITNFSETCPEKFLNNCGSNPTSQLPDKIPWDERVDHEVQHDSCISSDTGPSSQVTQVKVDNGDHWPGSFNGLGSGSGHEYVLEPCDAKVWDAGYMSCSKSKIDFLPTCSMIEEVFRDGS